MLAPTSPPEFAIEARGLDKTYRAQGKGEAVHALKTVDLAIPRGSFRIVVERPMIPRAIDFDRRWPELSGEIRGDERAA